MMGSMFIGVAIKGTAIFAMAWIAAFLMRGRSAAARHLVWTAAAAGALALPFLSISLPALRVPVELLPVSTVVFQATASAPQDAGASVRAAAQQGASIPLRLAPNRVDWRVLLVLLWGAGAAAVVLQLLLACAAIWRIRHLAKPSPDRDLCGALAQALGISRQVEVLETEAGSMPMTCGLLRSAIFMPSDASQWSEERRRVVMLHELAHVRRGDVATHLLVRAALAIYWWNPLAWTAWREFLKERERAADDLVLNAGTRASEYASHLLEVARTMQRAPVIGCAAVAMARRSQLEGRMLAILNSDVNRKTPGRAAAFLAVLLAVGMVAPLAAVQAQDSQQTIPADVDAAIRAAISQKNHEVLENAAKAAERLQEYDTAKKLLDSAVAIRAEVSGQQSVDYGVGLLKLGDLEQKRHNKTSAEDFYTKAAQVLGDRPEAAPALMHLGTIAIGNKNLPQAFDLFQRAQRIDPVHAGTALMWMAIVREREQNPYEAESLFKSALSLVDPKSQDAVVIMKLNAQLLRQQGRADEASELDARLAAAQKAIPPQIRPQSSASSGVYRVGGGVTQPSVLRKVEPEYAEEARIAKFQGTVVVSAEIGTDGLAHNVTVVRSLGLGLDEKAVEAVSKWQFRPGTKDGQAVTVAATIEINFHLL